MATTEEIISKNTEILKAIINGDVESANIGGIEVFRSDVAGCEFQFMVGGLVVYGDELEIWTFFAHLKNDGDIIASLSLMEA